MKCKKTTTSKTRHQHLHHQQPVQGCISLASRLEKSLKLEEEDKLSSPVINSLGEIHSLNIEDPTTCPQLRLKIIKPSMLPIISSANFEATTHKSFHEDNLSLNEFVKHFPTKFLCNVRHHISANYSANANVYRLKAISHLPQLVKRTFCPCSAVHINCENILSFFHNFIASQKSICCTRDRTASFKNIRPPRVRNPRSSRKIYSTSRFPGKINFRLKISRLAPPVDFVHFSPSVGRLTCSFDPRPLPSTDPTHMDHDGLQSGL